MELNINEKLKKKHKYTLDKVHEETKSVKTIQKLLFKTEEKVG